MPKIIYSASESLIFQPLDPYKACKKIILCTTLASFVVGDDHDVRAGSQVDGRVEGLRLLLLLLDLIHVGEHLLLHGVLRLHSYRRRRLASVSGSERTESRMACCSACRSASPTSSSGTSSSSSSTSPSSSNSSYESTSSGGSLAAIRASRLARICSRSSSRHSGVRNG